MNFEVGDNVRLKRDLLRGKPQELYVSKGEKGFIVAIFANTTKPKKHRKPLYRLKHRTWYAQVLISENGKQWHRSASLKTVRLTSLELV